MTIATDLQIEELTGYHVGKTGMLIGAPCCCFGEDHRGHPYCDEPTPELFQAEADGLIVRHFQGGVWCWFVNVPRGAHRDDDASRGGGTRRPLLATEGMSMEWIAADERLPEPDEWVLAWTGKYHWIAMISPQFGVWVGTYENEYWREPTHWMPLPSPPQE